MGRLSPQSWCRALLALFACSVCGYAWRPLGSGAWWVALLSLLSAVLLLLSELRAADRSRGLVSPGPQPAGREVGTQEFDPRLGELLVARYGLLTQAQLERALAAQQGTPRRLGQVLLEMGLVREEDLSQALEDQRLWRSIWPDLERSVEQAPETAACVPID